MAKTNDRSSTQLHLTFIEMLFALAIGEVAIDVGSLVSLRIEGSVDIASTLPAYSHLLLATMVIAASWVGWRNSEFSGSKIKSVFSLDFVELLVDVFLVICYFLLVRLAEIPTSPCLAIVPDASREAWMIMVIMATYVFWDFLSCRTEGSKLKLRVWASGVSLAMSVIAVCFLPLHSHDRTAVILMDIALLALVFLFRAMKLHDWRKHTAMSKVLIGSLTLIFAMVSILARRAV
jgi:hypothetical protein